MVRAGLDAVVGVRADALGPAEALERLGRVRRIARVRRLGVSGSTGSSGGSGSGSRRHSNLIAVSGVRLSVAVNSKVADVFPVGLSEATSVMIVCGGSVSVWPTRGGTSPVVHTTPMHCSKSGGGGCGGLPGSTSGAPLPAAWFPPPSMFVPVAGSPGASGASPATMPWLALW